MTSYFVSQGKIVPYVELSVVHASVLSLLVISLERYHVICQPLQAGHRCTRAKATATIAVIWTVAFLSAGCDVLPFSPIVYVSS